VEAVVVDNDAAAGAKVGPHKQGGARGRELDHESVVVLRAIGGEGLDQREGWEVLVPTTKTLSLASRARPWPITKFPGYRGVVGRPEGCAGGRELGDEGGSTAFSVRVAIADLHADGLKRASSGGKVVGAIVAGDDDVAFGVSREAIDITGGEERVAIAIKACGGACHVREEEQRGSARL
jgi:hypothetical protein